MLWHAHATVADWVAGRVVAPNSILLATYARNIVLRIYSSACPNSTKARNPLKYPQIMLCFILYKIELTIENTYSTQFYYRYIDFYANLVFLAFNVAIETSALEGTGALHTHFKILYFKIFINILYVILNLKIC